MRVLALLTLLAACGDCDLPPCEAPGASEWCLLSLPDGGTRVVGSP